MMSGTICEAKMFGQPCDCEQCEAEKFERACEESEREQEQEVSDAELVHRLRGNCSTCRSCRPRILRAADRIETLMEKKAGGEAVSPIHSSDDAKGGGE